MISCLHQNSSYFFRGLWLFVLLFLSSCESGQNNQSIIMNMSYHDARKIILQNGWRPSKGLPPYNKISAVAHHFRDLGYAEVEECAGAGATSPCIFYFQNDDGEYLKIGTEGEDNSLRSSPKVVYAAIRDKLD